MIKDADEVKVTLGDKQDSSLPAEFIGEDDDKDIAVLRLLDTGGMRLRPVKVSLLPFPFHWHFPLTAGPKKKM